jgi:hypothetical protein
MGRRRLLIGCKWFFDADILKGVFLISVFVPQVKMALNFNLLSLSKRERKTNYFVDGCFKDTLGAGPSKTDKAPKMTRAPKQIAMCVIFYDFCNDLYPNVMHIAKISSSLIVPWRNCRSVNLPSISEMVASYSIEPKLVHLIF